MFLHKKSTGYLRVFPGYLYLDCLCERFRVISAKMNSFYCIFYVAGLLTAFAFGMFVFLSLISKVKWNNVSA